MVVQLQLIHTSWTKDFRGGQAAALRNSMPEAVPFPQFSLDARALTPVVHKVEAGPKFRPLTKAVEIVSVGEPLDLGPFHVRINAQEVVVDYLWTFAAGAPERMSKRNAVQVSPGETGRLITDGRKSEGYASWWEYHKWVLNVGFFPTPEPDAFVRADPTHIYKAMALLR